MLPLPSVPGGQQEIGRSARAGVILAQGRRCLGHQVLALKQADTTNRPGQPVLQTCPALAPLYSVQHKRCNEQS